MRSSGLRCSARSSRSNSSPAIVSPLVDTEIDEPLRATLKDLAQQIGGAGDGAGENLGCTSGASYEISRLLGEGSYATVYLVKRMNQLETSKNGITNDIFPRGRKIQPYQALKVVFKEQPAITNRVLKYLKEETEIHRRLQHPFIVSM